MQRMAQNFAIFGLIGVLCNSVVGSYFPRDDTITLSCSSIEHNFKQGLVLFGLERLKALYLAKIGYVRNRTEPFAILFVKSPLPRNATEEFDKANEDLRGTQRALDEFKRFNVGCPDYECLNCKCFLDESSSCMPGYKNFSNSNIKCDPKYKYRSYDGTCNNLENPLAGSILTPFCRLIHAAYDDGVLEPRRANKNGAELKSPRIIVNKIFAEHYIHIKETPGFFYNTLFLFIGQLLVHDMASQIATLNPDNYNDGAIQCCSGDFKTRLPNSLSHFACMPIDIPKNDENYGPKNLRCHNFVRSQPAFRNDKRICTAEQANRVSGFIDCSVIYDVTKARAAKLRLFKDGKLMTSPKNMLPLKDGCTTNACFIGGDFRTNQTPQLAASQTLFVRMHNQIAGKLSKLNPHWDDERIFQEARKIVIAMHQHIVFTEYIPNLLNEHISCNGHHCECDGKYCGTAINDFSTGVFRFLHAYIPGFLETYGPDGKRKNVFQLSKILGDTRILHTNFPDVICGMLYQRINNYLYHEEVRNKLFNGSDLVSIDIQRGRDHGIPPYYRYREICNLPEVKCFDDLYPLISRKDIENLRRVYDSVYDIDLLVGGALEKKENGLLMGPTFNCLAKIQFTELKCCDRFFYTNKNQFTKSQLYEIKKFTFSKFLALTTSLKKLPLYSFYVPSSVNPLEDCDNLRSFDLSPWLDKN